MAAARTASRGDSGESRAKVRSLSQREKPPLGLRERKKPKTRAAIQQYALRLFRDQGYDESTIEEIAEVAEVSESTVYRYFSTKEDLVLWNEFDPLLIEAFREQPAELSPLQALRRSFRGRSQPCQSAPWAITTLPKRAASS
jgi:AcrR family transcriptional regulator